MGDSGVARRWNQGIPHCDIGYIFWVGLIDKICLINRVYVTCEQIFIEDMHEVEMLPRERVLDYLERKAKPLVETYLVR